TRDLFREVLLPHIASKKVAQYHQWHLSDELEQNDKTVRPLFGYGRSLLFLVSESFEGGHRTPLLRMQRYYDELKPTANMPASALIDAREPKSAPHSGFSTDEVTRDSVIRHITAARD